MRRLFLTAVMMVAHLLTFGCQSDGPSNESLSTALNSGSNPDARSPSNFASHPLLDARAQHADDTLVWASQSPPQLRVSCPHGIGSLRLTKATNQDWPEAIEVVLPLAALEGFAVRSERAYHRLEVTREGEVLTESATGRVLHMNSIEAIETSRLFRISVDLGELAESTSSVRLEWVDYYR